MEDYMQHSLLIKVYSKEKLVMIGKVFHQNEVKPLKENTDGDKLTLESMDIGDVDQTTLYVCDYAAFFLVLILEIDY